MPHCLFLRFFLCCALSWGDLIHSDVKYCLNLILQSSKPILTCPCNPDRWVPIKYIFKIYSLPRLSLLTKLFHQVPRCWRKTHMNNSSFLSFPCLSSLIRQHFLFLLLLKHTWKCLFISTCSAHTYLDLLTVLAKWPFVPSLSFFSSPRILFPSDKPEWPFEKLNHVKSIPLLKNPSKIFVSTCHKIQHCCRVKEALQVRKAIFFCLRSCRTSLLHSSCAGILFLR